MTQDDFVDFIDKEPADVVIVIHIYQTVRSHPTPFSLSTT